MILVLVFAAAEYTAVINEDLSNLTTDANGAKIGKISFYLHYRFDITK